MRIIDYDTKYVYGGGSTPEPKIFGGRLDTL